eukprot:gb/GEZN01024227.1/.p1 GENE.gb/GEZN01024227.1/~~gb/GEZN01024227.1/.p1  ORF type:complete len:153 (-),score=16.50 gb/GEZN01024227.1/:116-544(-)
MAEKDLPPKHTRRSSDVSKPPAKDVTHSMFGKFKLGINKSPSMPIMSLSYRDRMDRVDKPARKANPNAALREKDTSGLQALDEESSRNVFLPVRSVSLVYPRPSNANNSGIPTSRNGISTSPLTKSVSDYEGITERGPSPTF